MAPAITTRSAVIAGAKPICPYTGSCAYEAKRLVNGIVCCGETVRKELTTLAGVMVDATGAVLVATDFFTDDVAAGEVVA